MISKQWPSVTSWLAVANLFVCSVLAAGAITAQAQPPDVKKGPADEKTIRSLIAQLGDESYEKREASQKRLVDIGEPALTSLRKTSGDSRDAEVRIRAQKVVQEIEQNLFRVALNENQWGFAVDPDKDCVFRVEAARMHIKIPGTAHRLASEAGAMNAPRVLRDIEGDFRVEVKVQGSFPSDTRSLGGDAARAGAGLLVWQDEKNYLRLERTRMHLAPKDKWICYLNWEFRREARLARFGVWEDGVLDEDKPALLRLERKGKAFLASYSQDGKEWHQLPVINTAYSPKLLVGVTAVQNTAAGYEAVFEGLKVAPGKKAN